MAGSASGASLNLESRVKDTVNGQPPAKAAIASGPPTEKNINKIPHILPHERVFPIQIGCELFKLSGASLSSDAPSYFSQYFLCQIKTAEENGDDACSNIKTLYIDRDPDTFRDITLHLQGYHVQPRDGTHFVRLFADAQFYSLPRLISQLYEESIFISIGHREFQISRDVLTDAGNTPNYFSLGFAFFFSRHNEQVFPGLDREGLIRPPPILPPSVPNRSADTFAQLLHLLAGYPVEVRDETHRQELLSDARYFHFKGVEQKLIPHFISYNQRRGRNEITLRLENIQKSGIGILRGQDGDPLSGWVEYARPYVDDKPAELVLEIAGEATRIHFSGGGPRAEFFNDAKARVAKLFEVIATKLNLSNTTQPLGLLMASGGASSQPVTPGNTPLSEDHVRVLFAPESAIILDGKELIHERPAAASPADITTDYSASGSSDAGGPPRKRRRGTDGGIVISPDGPEQWTVRTGQWRLQIVPATAGKSAVECVLVAVKIDALSSEHARNMAKGFLTS